MRSSDVPLRLLLAWSLLLSPLASSRAAEPSAVDYLTPRTIAALTVRPAEAAGLEVFQVFPIEIADAAMKKHLGLPLTAVQRVTAVAEPPAGPTPQYAIVFNSSQPIDLNRFDPELLKHTTPSELEGRPLMESTAPMLPSVCLLDQQTLALGPKPFLKRLLAPRETVEASPLTQAMQTNGGEANHLHAAIIFDPLKPLMQMGLAQAMQEAPPETHKYFQAVDLVQGSVLALDLTFQRDSSLMVYANNASDATRLEELMRQGIAEMRVKAFNQSEDYQRLAASDDPVEQATASYTRRLWEQLIEGSRPQRLGDSAFVLGRIPAGEDPRVQSQVAMIGVLVALMVPAVEAARAAARRNQSMNNMKQLVLAMHNYHDSHSAFPAQAIYAPDGSPLLSWRVALLPYLGHQELYAKFNLNEPWDSPNNLPLIAEMPTDYFDPASKLGAAAGKSHYLGVAGPNAVFTGEPNGVGLRSISDGSSKTMMLIQVSDQHAVEWTKPQDYQADRLAANPFAGIGALHPEVFLAGYCDGSVSAVPLDVADETLRALMTRNGGEIVERP